MTILKVFISYSHDDDAHQRRVYALADRLIKDGVKIILDRDCVGGPDEDWDKWSEMQAAKADIVLPVFTPEYLKCWDREQQPGTRLGAIVETKVIFRRVIDAGNYVGFCRPIIFEAQHRSSIPDLLKGLHTFNAQTDYAQIIAWLRGKGAAPVPEEQTDEISWPQIPADYAWPLADRADQFNVFKNMLSGRIPQRIFLLEGDSNTGKTVLLNALFLLSKQVKLSAVQLDLKGCPSLDDLFDHLALDADAGLLPAFHSATGTKRKTALLQDLVNLKKPFLLSLDTYQQISPDIADWLESQLLRRVENCPALLILKEISSLRLFIWRVAMNSLCSYALPIVSMVS